MVTLWALSIWPTWGIAYFSLLGRLINNSLQCRPINKEWFLIMGTQSCNIYNICNIHNVVSFLITFLLLFFIIICAGMELAKWKCLSLKIHKYYFTEIPWYNTPSFDFSLSAAHDSLIASNYFIRRIWTRARQQRRWVIIAVFHDSTSQTVIYWEWACQNRAAKCPAIGGTDYPSIFFCSSCPD